MLQSLETISKEPFLKDSTIHNGCPKELSLGITKDILRAYPIRYQ